MLLNLSHHNSSDWPENQKKMALKEFQSVKDMEFPAIDPGADEDHIQNLALKYARTCRELLSESNDRNSAIHIMGEMTFVYKVVSLLKASNITCIASTTTRNVTQNRHEKISVFKFIRFREY